MSPALILVLRCIKIDLILSIHAVDGVVAASSSWFKSIRKITHSARRTALTQIPRVEDANTVPAHTDGQRTSPTVSSILRSDHRL